ncbi:MAG: isochorismatase family protein [Chloroflexi bacterium]|nr:isochorismatase family protein [Chloroflexota bacterium]
MTAQPEAPTIALVYSVESKRQEQYARAGFAGRVGWGERPALLVIDMARAWVDPTERLGSDLSGVLRSIQAILSVARDVRLPIFFTTMAYDSPLEIGSVVARKLGHLEEMKRGSDRVSLVPELGRLPHEPLIEKPRASAFFGTHLLDMLISERVDTVIVTGCSTSGCIRGTCESAFNYNYHVLVPREAVGDRNPEAHAANLFDIDARYADVISVAETLEHLRRFTPAVTP